MKNTIPFRERVRRTLISSAQIYQHIFVEYDYLILSADFRIRSYYIVSADQDNFLHLTGVHTTLSASEFPEDQETDDTKAPTLAGIKMKDGTEYTSDILGAGQNGYTSQDGKKAEDSFSFAKVVDTDQVSAILVNSKNGEIAEVPID